MTADRRPAPGNVNEIRLTRVASDYLDDGTTRETFRIRIPLADLTGDLAQKAQVAVTEGIDRLTRLRAPRQNDQYTVAWLTALAESINPVDAPEKKTIKNKLPKSRRTGSYSRDLPNIREAFPKIAWPDTYLEAAAQVSDWDPRPG